MFRLQLALNVNDIAAAVAFYSTLFDTAPVKRRPGYANFAVADPPLKLVLFESPATTGTLNHLGVERESMEQVEAEATRLEAAGLSLDVEGDVVCCYARQDKHWVTGPDGQRWENYVVLADAYVELEGRTHADLTLAEADTAGSTGGCCGTATMSSSDTSGSITSEEPVGSVGARGCCG